MIINIKTATEINIKSTDFYRMIDLAVSGVGEHEILSQISLDRVLEYFGKGTILNNIGKDECIVHFDLGPEEEQ